MYTMHGLGSASPPVAVMSASGELETPEPATSLLGKLVSIFSSVSITTVVSDSRSLAIPCLALAPNCFDASSRGLSSRINHRPYGRGYIVPGALDSAW